MSTDYIFWTFSAAAQCIAAFVAFLLTGYALVHTLMDTAREADDSLEEIHLSLRSSYHKRLTVLAWLTGAAIVLSLLVVYFNRSDAGVPRWWLAVVGAIDLAAIVGGLAFVVSIVDPRKYQKAAEKVLEQGPVAASSEVAPAAEFFDEFRHLEKLIRDYLREHDLYAPGRSAPRAPRSFRQMVDALLQNERIDRDFSDELFEINRYRNLVFHGHVDKAELAMLRRVRSASARVEQLASRRIPGHEPDVSDIAHRGVAGGV